MANEFKEHLDDICSAMWQQLVDENELLTRELAAARERTELLEVSVRREQRERIEATHQAAAAQAREQAIIECARCERGECGICDHDPGHCRICGRKSGHTDDCPLHIFDQPPTAALDALLAQVKICLSCPNCGDFVYVLADDLDQLDSGFTIQCPECQKAITFQLFGDDDSWTKRLAQARREGAEAYRTQMMCILDHSCGPGCGTTSTRAYLQDLREKLRALPLEADND